MTTLTIPLDPQDYDSLPPEDLDLCSRCGGQGTVFTSYDENGHAMDKDCPRCGGTGLES